MTLVSWNPSSSPFRWQDWAAPFKHDFDHPQTDEGRPYGWKRQELFSKGDGKLFDFINTELLPHLHALDFDPKTKLPNPTASRKQRVIGRIMTAVERVRVDSETNLRDILDKVDEISIDHVDDTHFFTLSQVYEDLLLKMGEKNSDGGQFFTPREIIRAMVHTIRPKLGETIYDALTEAWRQDDSSTGKFPSYARLLSARGTLAGESRYSWTVDFAARRLQAREDMKPHLEEAERAKSEMVSLKEKLKASKANPKVNIELLEAKIQEQAKAAREAQAKAEGIDASVFDLKAVNPNSIVKIDTRPPEEVIQSIADQGTIVARALSELRALLQA